MRLGEKIRWVAPFCPHGSAESGGGRWAAGETPGLLEDCGRAKGSESVASLRRAFELSKPALYQDPSTLQSVDVPVSSGGT
jgi:hypothetical protein